MTATKLTGATPCNRKRSFLMALLASPLFATASAAQANRPVRRIGLLMAGAGSDPDSQQRVIAFVGALQGLGWAEGRQVRLERRWAAGDPVLFRAHAAELVAMAPDLLLADGTPSVAALLRETRQLPVVFVRVGDPVGSGFVESFARPGGNATGFVAFDPLMGPKWIEFLREAVPGITRVGLLFHPGTAPHVEALFLGPIEASARALGLGITALRLRGAGDIEPMLRDFAGPAGTGLVAMPDTFLVDHRAVIIALAARQRLPTIYTNRIFAAEGGLLSYGFPVTDAYRQAAAYADRLLRGARTTELPVQAPTNWQLVVNQRAAESLGLALPAALLARADEVIE
jgi:putative ABC transport system substrate-binding protein